MRNLNCNILSDVDTGSINGSQIDSNQLITASFQAVFGDATAAGTVKIQASNDICHSSYEPGTFVVTNWTDIPNATVSITGGASGLITVSSMAYRWIRAVYTRTSGGSTTINVNMNALSQ